MYNAILGGNLVFMLPCESKDGNALIVDLGIAMSSKCRDKEELAVHENSADRGNIRTKAGSGASHKQSGV